MKKIKKAFTLIELLVVIAIIGILATLAVVALQQARSSARDIRRVSDMKQISTALDLFMYENGRYPTEEEFYSVSGMLISPSSGEVFMYQIPEAPTPADGDCSNSDNSYVYNPSNDGSSYTMGYCLGKTVSDISFGGNCASPAGLSGSEDCVFSSGPGTVNYDDPDPLCDYNNLDFDYEIDGDGYKLIHTCCELQYIGMKNYSSGDKFRLANNIDCSNSVNWTWEGQLYTKYFRPIMSDPQTLESVKGLELDGGNFTISNLMIESVGPGGSLFGYDNSGAMNNDMIIKNIRFENPSVSGSGGGQTGLLIGSINSPINVIFENIHINSGNISVQNGMVGSLAAYLTNNVLSVSASDISIVDSSFSSTRVGVGGMFGIIAHVPMTVYRSYVSGSTISVGDNIVGGLIGEYNVGDFNSTILESYVVDSTVSGNSGVGGFIGTIYSSGGETPLQLKNSFIKNVSIVSIGASGGFFGSSYDDGFLADNVYFQGSFDSSSSSFSQNFGSLSAAYSGGSSNNSYFVANLSNPITSGGNCLVNYNNPSFLSSNTYYIDGFCLDGQSSYGTEKTEIELKTASTYSSWSPVSCVNANEDNPWVIKDGSYPCLYFEESCTCD
ncbi:MAG: type II secretion system protein [Patescibacteria group bacterium]